MIVHAVPQRSAEWFALRLGKLTGSRAADMLAKIKTGPAKSRENLRVDLALERLTGVSMDSGFVSKDMQNGIDTECEAIAAYEAQTGHLVAPVGFVQHDTLLAGCSPDGEIDGFTGGVEVKCRKSANHLAFLKSRTIPGEAVIQCTHGLWITGASWWDYASYDPKFPAPLRLLVVRVQRSDVDLAAYELAARLFLSEVDAEVETVARMASVAA